ncbi:MAG TPA: glycosyltransferase family 39 protein [Candidatus Dormibacteraeota bacterium]|nr:glycosyltransferase family 39 protein [Candidatus Dormibacteraeota bacterium]
MNQPATASTARRGFVSAAHWLTLFLLLAAGTAVRFLCLSCKPFWFDECFSVEAARIDWRNFLHLLWWREANMSLYYVLLRIWLHFGQSPFFIRSLSVVISVGTLPAVYWLARQLYNRRIGLIAAALFAFNAFDVRYSQEVRSYALFVLLATLSSGFMIAALREPTRRNRIAYVVFSVLAVYAHFYALLLLAAQWLALRWLRNRSHVSEQQLNPALSWQIRAGQLRSQWKIIGLAVIPVIVFVAKTGAGPIRWIPRPGLQDLIVFFEHLAGSNRWPLPALCAAAIVLAVLPLGRSLWSSNQTWEVWRCQFLLIWLLFPTLLTVLLSFARPVFLARYMIFCLPALAILAAAGIARLRQAWLLGPVLAAMLLLGLHGTSYAYGHDYDSERDASGAAVNFILDHTEAGDAILFHIAETRVPYEFFRSVRVGENTASPHFDAQLGPEILFPRHGPGLDYRDFTGKPTSDFVRTATMGHPRIWIMLMNNGTADKPDPTTVMLTQILPESFAQMQRWQFAKVEVRLYSRQ